MKASQMAKVEAVKLKALAESTYYQVLSGPRAELAMDVAGAINHEAERMDDLAKEFEQAEANEPRPLNAYEFGVVAVEFLFIAWFYVASVLIGKQKYTGVSTFGDIEGNLGSLAVKVAEWKGKS